MRGFPFRFSVQWFAILLVHCLVWTGVGFGYGGDVEGTTFEFDLPSDDVKSLLPDGLELVQSVIKSDTHPVLLTFCVQSHVGAPFTDFNYKELIVTVPYVQWDDAHAPSYKYRGPFSYLPHLYLNETTPVKLGQWWAGDDKEIAQISQIVTDTGGNFRVIGNEFHPFAGKVIVDANWTTVGSYQNSSAFPSFVQHFAKGYNLPSIGRYPKDGGPWKCLPQDYHTDQAQIMPAFGTVIIKHAFIGKFPTGTFNFTALGRSTPGGYRMKTAWQYMSLIADCKDFDPDDKPCQKNESTGKNGLLQPIPSLPNQTLHYTDPCVSGPYTICNYQFSVTCNASIVSQPENEEQLRAAVLDARNFNLSVRAIGIPHSDNGVWCKQGGALIMMGRMNRILLLDRIEMTVNVEAGVRIGDLTEYLHAEGMALDALYPAFNGVTVGGAMGTGAHGSSLNIASAFGSALRYAEVMDAEGNIKAYGPGPTLKALQTHLGVLGVIVRMKLAVVPQFKVEIFQSIENDSLLDNGSLVQLCRSTDWIYAGWYPHLQKIVLRQGWKVPIAMPGNASTNFLIPPFPKLFMPLYSEINQFSVTHPNCSCKLESASLLTEEVAPPYIEGNRSGLNPAVGYSHRMMSGNCPKDVCPWHNGLRVQEMEIGVPFARAQEAITAMLNFFSIKRKTIICLPLQGVFFRVERGDSSFLGMGGGQRDSLVIGLTTWRPDLQQPRYHEQSYREIVNILMDNFEGRPHWAKNEPPTFKKRDWIDSFGRESWTSFQNVRTKMDPNGVFMNEFAETIFGV